MRIGFDLDDTLYSTYNWSIDWFKKHNVNVDPIICRVYDYIGVEESVRQNILKDLFSNDYVNDVGLLKDSKYVLEQLKDHEIFIITARGDNVKESTLRRLKEDFNITNNVYFTSNKTDICNELQLDIMVDDNINNYNLNILKSKLLWIQNDTTLLFDSDYNTKIRELREVLSYVNIS